MPCKLCQHACHYVYMRMNMPDTFGLLNIETFKSNCLVGNHSLRHLFYILWPIPGCIKRICAVRKSIYRYSYIVHYFWIHWCKSYVETSWKDLLLFWNSHHVCPWYTQEFIWRNGQIYSAIIFTTCLFCLRWFRIPCWFPVIRNDPGCTRAK